MKAGSDVVHRVVGRDRRRASSRSADQAPTRSGDQAGRRQRRAGGAGQLLERGVRPLRPHRRAGAADRARHLDAGAAHQRPAHAGPAARAARGGDRQRERHRGHQRDPVRRQRPAFGAGGPPGRCRRAGAAVRHRRPLRRGSAKAERAVHLRGVGPRRSRSVWSPGRGSDLGTGGMASKMSSALLAADAGVPVLLAAAADAATALADASVGTVFAARPARMSARRFWVRYAAEAAGALTLDDGRGAGGGAAAALVAARGDHRGVRAVLRRRRRRIARPGRGDGGPRRGRLRRDANWPTMMGRSTSELPGEHAQARGARRRPGCGVRRPARHPQHAVHLLTR